MSFSADPGLILLESVCHQAPYARFSILAVQPVKTIGRGDVGPVLKPPFNWKTIHEGLTSCGKRGQAPCTPQIAASIAAFGSEPVPFCRGLLDQTHAVPTGLPFVGGWAGFLPYELGESMIGLQPRVGAAPHLSLPGLALYDTVAVFDHALGQWFLAAVQLPESREPASHRLDRLEYGLAAADQFQARINQAGCNAGPLGSLPTPNMSRDGYLDGVARAQEHIAAGDIYQLNLTQRFSSEVAIDPLELYLRLRRTNGAAFSALIRDGSRWILSSSPELFLQSDGRNVVTRPIKGTIARPDDPARVEMARRCLAASGKDRAELNMIIDLLRNDLGRVCRFGSIRVESDGEIEMHPTVLHRVATIRGRLRESATVVDLLQSAFPGGSITGCPKIRAMQIIRELEPTSRDVYCGAIGYIGLDGAMCMNVAIRTMVFDQGRLHIHAGGAITADSDPQAEYEEVLAKAEGMFRAIGHTTADLANDRSRHPSRQKVMA